MRPFRRRPMHYQTMRLHDGTVLAAYPMRKPAPRIINRDHIRFDEDGATTGDSRDGRELTHVENRTRFQDIIATNLNTRRAIRELVLPVLAEMAAEVAGLRREVQQARGPRADAAGGGCGCHLP